MKWMSNKFRYAWVMGVAKEIRGICAHLKSNHSPSISFLRRRFRRDRNGNMEKARVRSPRLIRNLVAGLRDGAILIDQLPARRKCGVVERASDCLKAKEASLNFESDVGVGNVEGGDSEADRGGQSVDPQEGGASMPALRSAAEYSCRSSSQKTGSEFAGFTDATWKALRISA